MRPDVCHHVMRQLGAGVVQATKCLAVGQRLTSIPISGDELEDREIVKAGRRREIDAYGDALNKPICFGLGC